MLGDRDSTWSARADAARVCVADGQLERETAAALLVLSACAGEHVLLVGPPGSGKMALARGLARALGAARVFERLVTSTSTAEDLLGPLLLPELEAGRFARSVEGHLPTADVAILDEVLSASGPMLDGLLEALGDRRVPIGADRQQIPLAVCVGTARDLASVEHEQASLAERFLFTVELGTVSSLDRLLEARPVSTASIASSPLALEDLPALRAKSRSVALGTLPSVALTLLRSALETANVPVSNGRWRRLGDALRLSATLAGRDRVELEDLWIVPHAISFRATDRGTAQVELPRALHALVDAVPSRLAARAESLAREIAADAQAEELATDAVGAALFLDEDGKQTTAHARTRHRTDAKGNPLYHPPHNLGSHLRQLTWSDLWELHFQRLPGGMARLKAYTSSPTNQILEETPRTPVKRPRRWDRSHLEARREAVDSLSREVRTHAAALVAERARPTSSIGVCDAAIALLHAALSTLESSAVLLAKLPSVPT